MLRCAVPPEIPPVLWIPHGRFVEGGRSMLDTQTPPLVSVKLSVRKARPVDVFFHQTPLAS